MDSERVFLQKMKNKLGSLNGDDRLQKESLNVESNVFQSGRKSYDPLKAKVAVVTVTNRKQFLDNLINNYTGQRWKHKKLFLCLHGDALNKKRVDNNT